MGHKDPKRKNEYQRQRRLRVAADPEGVARRRAAKGPPVSAGKKRNETPDERAHRLKVMREYYKANKARLNENSRKWRINNPARVKYLNLASRLRPYGLTPEDYDRLLLEQDNSCAICGRDPWACRGGVLAVDHDHITGRARGLLCTWCNAGIGHLMEDEEILARAAEYLRKHR